MQRYFMAGNLFQTDMYTKFNLELTTTSAVVEKVKGKEDLVYEYIRTLFPRFRAPHYNEDPSEFYADYNMFKRGFVQYWRKVLDIEEKESQRIEDIFDKALISQEQSRNMSMPAVLLENGQALTTEDCLYAIYDVLKLK